MYVLDLLRSFTGLKHDDRHVEFEYRLACSGELFNGCVQTFDHRKSTACRILSTSPFLFFVSSTPFDEYPQELCLRFSAPMVSVEYGRSTSNYFPDEEIAEELCALLTLFCRRLITVACKTGENYPETYDGMEDIQRKWPASFINSVKVNSWRRLPCSVVTHPTGKLEIKDYNPPPSPLDPEVLSVFFEKLTNSDDAESFVRAAKLYHLAFQKIEEEPDIAYLLLISCIETMSNALSFKYQPTIEEMKETQAAVGKKALGFGLDNKQAEALIMEACKGSSWITKKFVRFLSQYIDNSVFEEDELFKMAELYLPKKSDFLATVKDVYAARGKMQHRGTFFPKMAALGRGPRIRVDVAMSFFVEGRHFPSVWWFERVANCALKNYLLGSETGAGG